MILRSKGTIYIEIVIVKFIKSNLIIQFYLTKSLPLSVFKNKVPINEWNQIHISQNVINVYTQISTCIVELRFQNM